ncbi:MAG: helix-turn-helix domain-containing protein [Thermodesulfobacteriota bacterium]
MEEPGDYLKREREIRGVTLENIALETKISVKALKALEDNDFNALPAYPFVKGFIRSYSRCIGIDGDDAALRYDAYLREKEDDDRQGGKKRSGGHDGKGLAEASRGLAFFLDDGKKSGAWESEGIDRYWQAKIIIPVAISLLIVLVAIIYFYTPSHPPSLSGVETKSALPVSASSPAKGIPSPSLPSPAQAPPLDSVDVTPLTFQELTLQMTAKKPTWMRVEIDAEPPFEVSLGAGEVVAWKAKMRFSLLIGNAGGVEGVLNGKPLDSFGDEGQVVRIKLALPVEGEGGE